MHRGEQCAGASGTQQEGQALGEGGKGHPAVPRLGQACPTVLWALEPVSFPASPTQRSAGLL